MSEWRCKRCGETVGTPKPGVDPKELFHRCKIDDTGEFGNGEFEEISAEELYIISERVESYSRGYKDAVNQLRETIGSMFEEIDKIIDKELKRWATDRQKRGEIKCN